MSVPTLRESLQTASAGLVYISESEAPFEAVEFPDLASHDPAALLARLGRPPGTPVETVSLDRFFERHIERVDPADAYARSQTPRYQALKDTLTRGNHHIRSEGACRTFRFRKTFRESGAWSRIARIRASRCTSWPRRSSAPSPL